MPSFTQVFGGTTIYPSDVSYRALALTANTTLTWPLETNSGSSVLASIIDITPTGAYSIFMPDAMLTSVGQTVLFNNLGPSTVTIKDSAGATLLSLAAGEVWQIYLTDNTTTAGSWRSFKYGATTAQAQASLLAGYGLVAIGSTLAQSSSITSLAVNYTIGDADRAKTFVWTGGLGTLTLPVAITVGNNWFVNVRNGGTGDLVIDPSGAEIINGGLTLNLSPGDSAVIVTDGTSWYTIGLGQQAVFAFDYTTISLTGLSGTYTLSGSELNRISYKFTGTLTGNIVIIVPSTVQQYWIDNSTSGSAFTLSVSTLGGTPVSIAQNLRAIYYCNGSNVIKADTTSGIATPLAIIDGGTGATSAGAALINLGGTSVGIGVFTATSAVTGRLALLAAASGANADITSLSGLTTPLSPAQGGTGITSLGTGVATALGINVGTAGSFTVNGGVLGTPSSGTVTNLTGTASININGTVGATTANTGSFTSLAYTTTLTGGTGIVNLGSGQFYKDASGNVGIGTTVNTLYKLQATGVVSSFTAAQAGYHLYNNGATSEWFMGQRSAADHSLSFSTLVASTYTDRMVISTGGLVGIGTTAPATQLDVRGGDITLSRTAAATAGDAALHFGNGGTTYIFAGNTSNVMTFAVSSSERVRIDSSGNVGIGTTSPVTYGKLAIVGTGTVTANIVGDSTSETQLKFYANTAARISNQANTPLIFDTNAVERMRIDASGNVGIGTPSPSTYGKLAVIGNISGSNFVFVDQVTTTAGTVGFTNSSGPGIEFYGTAAAALGSMLFKTAGVEKMRIDNSGNVGIGTSAPEYRLQVVGGYTGIGAHNTPTLAPSSVTGGAVFSWNRSVGGGETSITNPFNSATSSFEFLQKTGASTANVLYQMASTSHIFYTSNTEKMRIDNSGNVGIGTTTGTYQLQVKGTGQETAALTDAGLKGGALYLQATAVGAGSGGAVLFGTTFANATPFAAIKGFAEDGSTNTTGSLRFSTRNAIADTALTERAKFTVAGDFLLTSSGGLGYGTGSGGAVTQLTSRATGVTLNKTNGAITMFSAAGIPTPTAFVVTNSTVAATDVVLVSVKSSTNTYSVFVTSTVAGAFGIGFYAISGTATDAPVINYAVIKAVTA